MKREAMMNVQVITDSTSDIPREMAEELGIRIVPIYVRFGEKTYRDGVDIKAGQLYAMMTSSPVHPSTSQPNPEDFTGIYNEYIDRCPGIVSIHISSKISGTCNSAIIAREMMKSDFPIEVIDSGLNSGGLGLVVMAAARVARTGAAFEEVVAEARNALTRVRMFGMFKTMKYLARGGRVNKTIAATSNLFNIMPLLTFDDGEIVRTGLVRSISSGIDRIKRFVENNLPISELSIVHSQVPDQVEQLKNELGLLFPVEKMSVFDLGAGLGVHGGPGVILAAVRRQGPDI